MKRERLAPFVGCRFNGIPLIGLGNCKDEITKKAMSSVKIREEKINE
jgi:hypothetical protein